MGTKFGLYILSLAVPIAGFVIGAIYHGKHDPESMHVGRVCIALGLIPLLYIMIMTIIFLLAFGVIAL